MQELEKNILKTLVWFDVFSFPLVAGEVLFYLMNVNFLDKNFTDEQKGIMNYELRTKKSLDELVNKKKIEQKDEFYFLTGREEIVEIRKQRKEISLKKIKKVKKLVKFLKFVPWIKAIFLCNSVGYLNAKENSDIDLFIITKPNRIWSARWWSVGWLKLFNLRPNAKNKKDKFCLSYFVTEDNLNLEQTKISEFDVSLIYWLTSFQPLYFENDLWNKFVKTNEWVKKYLPNCELCESRVLGSANNTNILKNNFSLQEKILKKIQLWYLPKELKNASQENNNKVIINDKMLKFHLSDKRQEDFEKWDKNLKKKLNY